MLMITEIDGEGERCVNMEVVAEKGIKEKLEHTKTESETGNGREIQGRFYPFRVLCSPRVIDNSSVLVKSSNFLFPAYDILQVFCS